MGLSKTQQELKLIDTDGETHILKIRNVEFERDRTLLDLAVDNSVDLPHSCGGMGTCGTCRVKLTVQTGTCPGRNETEMEMAIERGFADDERLSCQLEIPKDAFNWTAESLGRSDEEW